MEDIRPMTDLEKDWFSEIMRLRQRVEELKGIESDLDDAQSDIQLLGQQNDALKLQAEEDAVLAKATMEEVTHLRQRVKELEEEVTATRDALDYLHGTTTDVFAGLRKDAERWRDKRSISNKITDVVAAQLHYFDKIENVHLSTCEADKIAVILNGAIGRYRNDPKFHAKVTSMVAQLMQRLYETDAAIDAAMEADK